MKEALIKALGPKPYAAKFRFAVNTTHKEKLDLLEQHHIQILANRLNDGTIANVGDKMAKEIIAAIGVHINEQME